MLRNTLASGMLDLRPKGASLNSAPPLRCTSSRAATGTPLCLPSPQSGGLRPVVRRAVKTGWVGARRTGLRLAEDEGGLYEMGVWMADVPCETGFVYEHGYQMGRKPER
ncbi:Protein of unknown function [Pyronema omphalodes CBS 100304]|uniref:Uncharacterized protein n=1 Tax=Pyronema omphalodes (strain CBS 100304) TaxID=1076935 RepID=U4LL34_PYROM|nr:Protein of unknown function [Pyronema omphalodes CBS 100304]